MLEQITLGQLLLWLFSAGGIAVLLQRIPGWDSVDPRLKTGIVTVISLVSPFILAALKANPVISGAWEQTLANITIGLFMSAAAFVIHAIDAWLTAQKLAAEARAEIAVAQYLDYTAPVPAGTPPTFQSD